MEERCHFVDLVLVLSFSNQYSVRPSFGHGHHIVLPPRTGQRVDTDHELSVAEATRCESFSDLISGEDLIVRADGVLAIKQDYVA